MKKGLKIVAASMATMIALTACSSKADEPVVEEPAVETPAVEEPAVVENPGGIPTTDPVELSFSWWGSDNRHEAMNEVARLYQEDFPNVTITTEYGAFDGWQQKVLTQLSGGTAPDVLQVNYNWVHSFGRGNNVFYNLNDLSSYIDLSNWDQTQLDAMTVGGELGAVPHGVTARAFLYNKALFAENGLEYPATYDEMKAAAAVIGANNTAGGATNQYVLTNIGKVSTDLFIAQMLYNETGKVMQTNGTMNYTVEEVEAALNLYKSLEDAGALPTFQDEDPIQNESNPVWTEGRSGSVYEWVGTVDKYLNSYKGGVEGAKDEIGVAPYVTVNAGDNVNVYVKPSLGYAVSKTSKNPEVAAHFLNYMFTDEDAIKALNTSLGVSSNKVTRDLQESEGMVTGGMKEGFDLLATYDQTVLDPYFEDENVRGQRYTAIEAFRTGEATAAEAAEAYITKQQEELDKLFK